MAADILDRFQRVLTKRGPHGRTLEVFRDIIYGNYGKYGREMAWRRTRDPYKILISEVMLQQTQVTRVHEKYVEFLDAFQDFQALASASSKDVLKIWQGLGYNRRALLLKRLAETVMKKYNGTLPQDPIELEKLPGIGYATASSICAFAFNKPVVFIETNIRSVFLYFFFHDKKNVKDTQIEPIVRESLDQENPRKWYWAIMDYGAKLKKEQGNANVRSAHYTRQSKFEGSNRQLRGMILKALLERPNATAPELVEMLSTRERPLLRSLEQLRSEGFIIKRGHKFSIP